VASAIAILDSKKHDKAVSKRASRRKVRSSSDQIAARLIKAIEMQLPVLERRPVIPLPGAFRAAQ
jgi:hypothetical protein